MSQLLAYEGASSSLEGEFQRFSATASLAEVFREEAVDARDGRIEALEAAERLRDEATAAAAAAQQVAADTANEKSRLLAELARLQGISVALAERRQSALEEIERQRAAREAAALLAAQSEAPEPDRPAPVKPDPDPEPAPEPPAGPGPAPNPPPAPGPAPAPSGGASRALQFARAQLGDPYVWGAAGPDAWDCSGLTMRAWQAGGRSLPHYSVAQYDVATPISSSQLRPGDLVFWGSSSSPGSIHHVALYLGDGMIIHAPRTGRPVSIDSMYYWVPPNFFARV